MGGLSRSVWRSRWAAIGAAIAVSIGGGGLFVARAASSPPSATVVIEPVRVLDSRDGNDVGLPGPFVSAVGLDLQVTGSIQTTTGNQVVVPDGATGVMMNVTVVNPSANGFVSIRPADAVGPPGCGRIPPGRRRRAQGVQGDQGDEGPPGPTASATADNTELVALDSSGVEVVALDQTPGGDATTSGLLVVPFEGRLLATAAIQLATGNSAETSATCRLFFHLEGAGSVSGLNRVSSRIHIPNDNLGTTLTIVGRADVQPGTYNIYVECQSVSGVNPPPTMRNVTMIAWVVAT